MRNYRSIQFPKTRLATLDICSIGIRKHHIVAILEIDVSECRAKIKKHKKDAKRISFLAWLIKTISITIVTHKSAAGYLLHKRKIIIFDHVNVSVAIEKKIADQRVPIPLIIEQADKKSIEEITAQINEASFKILDSEDIVLHKKSNRLERIYFVLPGFVRRWFWKYLLKNPPKAYKNMGNVAVTSISMKGNLNGWFIPISVHPVCFGIGKVIKKPVVIEDSIQIREVLNMTVLIDHDVIDGSPMARFLGELVHNIENGAGL